MLWYQSFGRERALSDYFVALRESLGSMGMGEEVVLHGAEATPAIGTFYRFYEFIDTREMIRAAILAEKSGAEAFLIGNILDPGMGAAREITNLPVLGLGQTSFHVACLSGANFGVVCANEKFQARVAECIRSYGLESRTAGFASMSSETTKLTGLSAAFVNPEFAERVVAQFVDAAAILARQGAEVIIPGAGLLMVLLEREGVNEVGGSLVLNGIPFLVRLGAISADYQRRRGAFISRRGSYKQASGDVFEELQSAYGRDLEKALLAPPAD
jgi:allantoin racemase